MERHQEKQKQTNKKVLKAPVIDEEYLIKSLGDSLLINSKILFSIFDFGGQSVFNIIHHLFLTRYGVYLIVFDMQLILGADREKCLAYLRFWIYSVFMHTHRRKADGTFDMAKIALVGTHKDIVVSSADHAEISFILDSAFDSNPAWEFLITYGYV